MRKIAGRFPSVLVAARRGGWCRSPECVTLGRNELKAAPKRLRARAIVAVPLGRALRLSAAATLADGRCSVAAL